MVGKCKMARTRTPARRLVSTGAIATAMAIAPALTALAATPVAERTVAQPAVDCANVPAECASGEGGHGQNIPRGPDVPGVPVPVATATPAPAGGHH